MKHRVRIILPLLAGALVLLAFWYAASQRAALPPGVISANGTIETTEVDVTGKVATKVATLPFREGDSVRAGELAVTLDDSDLRAAVQQAEGVRRAAQANLDELLAGTRAEEIVRTRAQYQAARAARQQAQARLDLVKAGPRVEEIEQQRAAVRQAEVSLHSAETELVRTESLAEKGALPTQQVDLLQTQRDVAAAQLDAARQRLLQAERGSRPEDLRAAEAAVAQASSQEEAAKASLDLAVSGPRKETVDAAGARVSQAEAAVAAAEVQLGYTRIAAPMAGTIVLHNLEPGELVTPGLPILRLAALDQVWLRVFISETDLGRVKVGQAATITVDTYPDRRYRGRVIEIAEEAEFTPRNVQTKAERQKLVFGVKIEVENPKHELKPGMPADALIDVSG